MQEQEYVKKLLRDLDKDIDKVFSLIDEITRVVEEINVIVPELLDTIKVAGKEEGKEFSEKSLKALSQLLNHYNDVNNVIKYVGNENGKDIERFQMGVKYAMRILK